MDINATLIGQMITFALFVWFTVKFVWPPISRVMEQRRKKIADGLAAAELGQQELEQAKITYQQIITDAKNESTKIIDQANQRGIHIVNEAKQQAQIEGERLLSFAKNNVDQMYTQVKLQLMHQVAGIAVSAAEKILQREVDRKVNDRLVEEIINEI